MMAARSQIRSQDGGEEHGGRPEEQPRRCITDVQSAAKERRVPGPEGRREQVMGLSILLMAAGLWQRRSIRSMRLIT